MMTQQEQRKFRAIVALIDIVRDQFTVDMEDPLLWDRAASDRAFEDLKAGVEKIFQR